MALKSDAQGFLSGDPIDIGRAISVLEQIRSDVRAIRSAIKGSGGSPGAVAEKQATVTPEQRKSAPGVKRDSLIRPVATPAGRTRSPAIPKVNANSPAIPAGNSRSLAPSDANIVKALNQIGREIAKPSGRDAKGRFTPKIVDSKSPDALKKAKENNDKDKELKALASGRVGDIASAGVEKVAEVDPAVQAFQEIAQPLARGWEMISKGRGSKDKDAAAQTGLLRRVYATLTGFRSEAFITGKAANKSLKNLEDKPEGGAESGGILSMLSKIPFIGPMIVSAITALGAGLMSLLSKIPGFGFLKKVPVTGALGVGG
ncbi:hypothetical protein, partial [Propionivibrio sp.]|uniref:hypothetical protein n=1 Tax=Propionivibrio sp. TaxID=2212460 RepID=UPI003BF1A399